MRTIKSPIQLNNDQFQALQQKVQELGVAKAAADQAAAESGVAHANLSTAQADVVQKDAVAAEKRTASTNLLNQLRDMIDALADQENPPTPAPPGVKK